MANPHAMQRKVCLTISFVCRSKFACYVWSNANFQMQILFPIRYVRHFCERTIREVNILTEPRRTCCVPDQIIACRDARLNSNPSEHVNEKASDPVIPDLSKQSNAPSYTLSKEPPPYEPMPVMRGRLRITGHVRSCPYLSTGTAPCVEGCEFLGTTSLLAPYQMKVRSAGNPAIYV